MSNPYYMGPPPTRRRVRRPRPQQPAPAVNEGYPIEATRVTWSAAGHAIVVNPNKCLICHRPRHRDIPHHAFEPDQATLSLARDLGWSIPVEVADL